MRASGLPKSPEVGGGPFDCAKSDQRPPSSCSPNLKDLQGHPPQHDRQDAGTVPRPPDGGCLSFLCAAPGPTPLPPTGLRTSAISGPRTLRALNPLTSSPSLPRMCPQRTLQPPEPSGQSRPGSTLPTPAFPGPGASGGQSRVARAGLAGAQWRDPGAGPSEPIPGRLC